jgi:hypothetical protein
VSTDATASYADVVAALVAARQAPAVARFDAEIAAALATGAIDADLARALRWWQRESVREVTAHVVAVVPAVLAALAASASDASTAFTVADEAWRAAAPNASAAPAGASDRPRPAGSVPPRRPAAGPSRRRLVVAGLTRTG